MICGSAAGRAGRLEEGYRGCWLLFPFLSFPSFTALFLLIAGIMVHPRPVLSQCAWFGSRRCAFSSASREGQTPRDAFMALLASNKWRYTSRKPFRELAELGELAELEPFELAELAELTELAELAEHDG